MSFYDDASLVFLPSGGAGKDTKAYSIKPTDGSGDFTFSRGGNLSATRVDSNGLIQKGRENLLTYSNDFSQSVWSMSGSAPIGSQDGYDGSDDAWSITGDVGDNWLFKRNDTKIQNSGVQTFSIYVKKNANYGIRIYFFGTSNVNTYFNLNNGTIVNESNTIDSKIEPVGSDWFRCSITFEQTTTQMYLYATDNSNVMLDGITHILQDAQLEQGLVATEYIESGATTGKAGILEDSPRFDYSGGASCPSLILEPSRTNLIGYSEYFEGTGWVKESGATIESNVDSSPDGNTNASYLKAPIATNSTIRINYTFSCTSSQTYVGSIFVKKENVDFIRILSTGATASTLEAFYNVSNGTLGSSGTPSKAIIEDYGNGWYRLSLVIDAVNTSSSATFRVQLAKTDGAVIDNFDGTEKNLICGAQLEQASYPTSYIPNHSGGSETRNADECTKTSISDLIGQTEGTIYCEFEYNGAADSGVFNRIIGLGTGVTQNRILLAKNDTTAELVAFAVTGGTTQVFQAIAGTSIIGHHKVAISYKANEYKVYLDGELEFTDTSASVPATTDVYIGTAEDGTTNNELGGIVKESIIYKEVLSEDNCKALTTL